MAPSDIAGNGIPAELRGKSATELREEAIRPWREAFAAAEGRVVVAAAGFMGRRMAQVLVDSGVTPVCFSDRNPRLVGTKVDGLPVLHHDESAAKYGATHVFVVASWGAHIREHMCVRVQGLRDLGCRRVVEFPGLYLERGAGLLPFYLIDDPGKLAAHGDGIAAASSLWFDEISAREYARQVSFRATYRFSFLGDGRPDQYFPADLIRLRPDEHFLDVGAYNGDTLADFLTRTGAGFGSYTALEPDPANFAAMQRQVSALPEAQRSRVTTRAVAASDSAGLLHFANSGDMSAAVVAGGGTSVEACTLDEVIGSRPVTFVKFDIEGAEPRALAGAKELFRRQRPIVAVSVYHEAPHLWELPLQMKRLLGPDYDFHLRQHGYDGWDLVAYAIPRERAV